jgi:hypothetical protein
VSVGVPHLELSYLEKAMGRCGTPSRTASYLQTLHVRLVCANYAVIAMPGLDVLFLHKLGEGVPHLRFQFWMYHVHGVARLTSFDDLDYFAFGA